MTTTYTKTRDGVETSEGYRADSVASLRNMLAAIHGLRPLQVILVPAR